MSSSDSPERVLAAGVAGAVFMRVETTLANNQPPAWLSALPALFAIGARVGGAPTIGTAALQGGQQGALLAEEQRQRQVAEGLRQQQIDLQSQAMLRQMAAQQEMIEERRLGAIRASIDDLRQQKFPSKKDYDEAIHAHESMLTQYYGARPNTLRAAVPYDGPTAQRRAREAVDDLIKQHGLGIVDSKAAIKFDRDETGTLQDVSMQDLVQLSGKAIARDPQGNAMLPPKDIKPENVQQFDTRFRGVLAEWKAEGKNIDDPVIQGKAVDEAMKRMAQASKTGSASVVVQTGTRDSDAEMIAEAIANGKQPPDLKGLYRMGPAVRAHLASKGYNLTAATQDWTATQRYLSTMNGPQQTRLRQAIDNAAHSLDVIETLADQWKGGRFPPLNRGRLMAAKNGLLGPEAQKVATALDAQIADVTSELANVYMGGYSPTDHSMSLAAKNLQADWSEGTLRKLLEQQRQNLRIRQNSIANAGAIGGREENPYAPTVRRAETPAGPGPVTVIDPNGKKHTFPTQEQADKFKAAAGIK